MAAGIRAYDLCACTCVPQTQEYLSRDPRADDILRAMARRDNAVRMRVDIARSRHTHIHEMACAGLSSGGRGASDTVYRKQSADGRRFGIHRTDSFIFFLDTAYRHLDDSHVGVIIHRQHRLARHSGSGENPVRAAATFLQFINL